MIFLCFSILHCSIFFFFFDMQGAYESTNHRLLEAVVGSLV